MKEVRMARVFEDVGGYYYCNEGLSYLDARGRAYPSKSAALRAAYRGGYTHAIGSGAYRQGKSIQSQVTTTPQEDEEHALSQADWPAD